MNIKDIEVLKANLQDGDVVFFKLPKDGFPLEGDANRVAERLEALFEYWERNINCIVLWGDIEIGVIRIENE